ncbi:MAG TPA: C39 family peptidase [Terracidiphilus sp.]|jgi:predicted double-glycine peptidase
MQSTWCCGALALATIVAAQSPAPLSQLPAVWIDVPFVAQPREGCGAAALSMVMEYWASQPGGATVAPQVDRDAGHIQQALYSPHHHGITASAMRGYLEQHGFRAFALSGDWNDLEKQLSKGRPLIVALRPEGQHDLHYVVVDGVDTRRGLVTMNDPAGRKLMSEERAAFEKDWKDTDNWMLLAVPAAAH